MTQPKQESDVNGKDPNKSGLIISVRELASSKQQPELGPDGSGGDGTEGNGDY